MRLANLYYYSMAFPFLLEAEAARLHTGSAGSFFTLKQYKKRRPELPAADSPELPVADPPELPTADPPELPTAESSETEGDSPETAENGNFLTTVLGPLLVKVFRWLMENSANLAGQYRA